MPAKRLVSVITPTMGRAGSFLLDCVASVNAQLVPSGWEVEHILALNGDFQEEAVVQEIASRHHNVRVVYSQKQGASVARNHAFLASQGEIIVDLDDDDILPITSIRDRVHHLLESDREWSVGNLLKIEEDRKYKIACDLVVNGVPDGHLEAMKAFLSGAIHAWTGTRTYHRRALEQAGPWDESFIVAEDLEHWLRLTATVGAPDYCDKYLCIFREKEYSLGINAVRSGLMKSSQERAIERWGSWTPGASLPEALPTWNQVN